MTARQIAAKYSMMVYFSRKFRTTFFSIFAALASFAFVTALTNSSPSSPFENCNEDKLLILGLGRVGWAVSFLALDDYVWEIYGTVKESSLRKGTDEGGHDRIIQVPFNPTTVRKHLFGGEEDGYPIDPSYRVLFTIPLSREADPVMAEVLKELRAWWESDIDGTTKESNDICQPKTLGIISTTGVYGNHDGKVVNESSELLCEENSNAELYRQFEDDWISLSDGHAHNRLRIFRCAGIYDESRSALHTVYKNLESGKLTDPIPKYTSSPPTTGSKTNRIHSFDLARAVVAGMFDDDIKAAVRIYNLADDLPEYRSVVLSYAQELLASLGIDQNSFGADNEERESSKQTSTRLLSRSSTTRQRRRERESKLVCNKRMKEELLQDSLWYPTYREGLQGVLMDSDTPWKQQRFKK